MDKNIPIPEPRLNVLDKYELRSLEPGDSILVPLEVRRQVQIALSRYKARSGRVFTIRKVDDNNARVWRIE